MAFMEKWIRWEPIVGFKKKHYYFKSIIDNGNKFEIIFFDPDDEQIMIRFFFDTSLESYRRVNETDYLETIGNLNAAYPDGFYATWSFFKIENSSYIQSLSGKNPEATLFHFCFVSGDYFFDIIAEKEPLVMFIK